MNNPYILTRRNLNPTAKLLARELGIRRYFEPRNYAPIIRWGNSDNIYEYDFDTELNDPKLISLSSNKLSFSNRMEIKEIPHVELSKEVPEKFPIVVREILYGTRGEGIYICESMDEYLDNGKGYWTYWYNFQFELGVHMLGGKIVRVFKKVREEGLEEEKYPIRNLHKGYHYSLVNIENYRRLPEFMANVYNKFPLEMGRWDIGWDSDNKTYRVIEANSAPGLAENENTLNCYVEFLKGKLNEQ
jgi:hypothetical protein